MSVGLDSVTGGRYCPTCENTFLTGDRCPNDGTRLVRIAQSDDMLIGRELDGRYTINEKLGQGGMGTVYRGTQHSVGREVAIKVVTPTLVSDPIVIKRFLRESKLSSALSHPNAVSVLDFGQTEDGLFYLIMELVVGRTLDAILDAERTLSPQRIVRIGTQICEALDGAHRLRIVHRDLKPQNVMLLSAGRDLVKVLDFGIAKSLTPRVGSSTMTNAGALLGTPAYMPPELVTGQECDHRADLYSLGCLLYVAASGELPFSAGSVHELIAMHATEPPKRLANVPAGLSAVIEQLLAKEPGQRFQSAAEARDALEKCLDGRGAVVEVADPTIVSKSSTMIGWAGTVPTPARRPIMTPSVPQPALAKAPTAGGERPGMIAPSMVKPAQMSAEQAAVVATSPTLIAPDGSLHTRLETTRDLVRPTSKKPWIIAGAVVLASVVAVIVYVLAKPADRESKARDVAAPPVGAHEAVQPPVVPPTPTTTTTTPATQPTPQPPPVESAPKPSSVEPAPTTPTTDKPNDTKTRTKPHVTRPSTTKPDAVKPRVTKPDDKHPTPPAVTTNPGVM